MQKALIIFSILFLLCAAHVSADNETPGPFSGIKGAPLKDIGSSISGFAAKDTPTPTADFWSALIRDMSSYMVSQTEEAVQETEEAELPSPITFPTFTPLPTSTPFPTATFTPTFTPTPTVTPTPTMTPDPLEGLEVQNGAVSRWYPCGQDLSFMIVYQPIMTKSQSGQTAEGEFILFRAFIKNESDRPITGLKFESFTLSKEGTTETYPLSSFFTTVTSRLWDLGLFRNEIPAKGKLDTYLVFDVQGAYNDPWVLNFVPMERDTDRQFSPIRLKLPKVAKQ